jgi:hypothetical protein
MELRNNAWLRFRWAVTGGTGKYEGLSMSGVNNLIAQHADGIVLGRFEGNHAEN